MLFYHLKFYQRSQYDPWDAKRSGVKMFWGTLQQFPFKDNFSFKYMHFWTAFFFTPIFQD